MAGRQAITRLWWNERRHLYRLFVSELVFREISSGDENAARRRRRYTDGIESLALNAETVGLSERLVSEGLFPSQYAEDALHVALCAVNGIDFLMTWNCKHLANAALFFPLVESLARHGYQCPMICTPEELMEG